MREMKNVCVFLSAQELDPKYTDPSLELVRRLVEHNYGFVYGGSERGLMKHAADEVRKSGGKIIAVCSEEFRSVWRKDVDELIECANIPERKRKIIEVSDALVVLPGGAGTLDEFTEIVENKKWGDINKPLILLNINSFWDGLITQWQRMQDEGFINADKPMDSLVFITDSVEEAINYLNESLQH